MSDESNGEGKGRLDRVEGLIDVLVNDHIAFREEHRQLLKAQVILYDTVQKLVEAQTASDRKLAELAETQKHTDERMAALIGTVDDLIRRPPQ